MNEQGVFILAIETSNPSAAGCVGGVALGRLDADGTTLCAERVIGAERRHDDALMPTIAAVCEDAGITPRQLRRVVVSLGPGGFTGVRSAVTTAAALAEATGAEAVGVPTALVAAMALDDDALPAVVLLASKRGTAHADVVESRPSHSDPGGMRQIGEIDADGLRALAHQGVRTVVADQHMPADMAGAARTVGLIIVPLQLSPSACLAAGVAATPVDPADLRPIYPREPEAVTKWRALHGRAPGDPD